MKYSRRHAIAVSASLVASMALSMGASHAVAQAYPSKPITLIVAYPAGGDTDAMARLFAEKLTTRLGQTVIVDNKPGASGAIGSAFVSKATPDGYTLLMAPSTFAIAPLVLKGGGGYDVLQGFTPVIQSAVQPLFVVAGTAVGAKDLKSLVALAKTKDLTYASPGSGSPMHILGEMFNKSAGIKVGHVPYRGVAPAVNDLLGGHVPVTFVTLGPVAPHVATGKMTLLAVADAQRSALAPNVPTLAELGYKDVEVAAWQGMFGPKGLPDAVVKTLNQHMNEILKMPDVVSKMAVFGALPVGGESAKLEKASAADHTRFAKIVKEFGIQAD